MTLLVGLYCTDGVIIGSDSAATMAAGRQVTIGQQPSVKVDVIDPDVLLATTGSVGLGQRFRHHVQKARGENAWRTNVHEATVRLATAVRGEFQSTQVPFSNTTGLSFGALLGARIGTEHHLVEFETFGLQPERRDEQLMFASMGSGQLIADPFLGFIRTTLWEEQQPNLREGLFGVLWTLRHTIAVNPGGVGGVPQIGVIEQDQDSAWRARLVDVEELQEMEQHCESMERHIRDYRTKLRTPDQAAEVPPVPEPPVSDQT